MISIPSFRVPVLVDATLRPLRSDFDAGTFADPKYVDPWLSKKPPSLEDVAKLAREMLSESLSKPPEPDYFVRRIDDLTVEREDEFTFRVTARMEAVVPRFVVNCSFGPDECEADPLRKCRWRFNGSTIVADQFGNTTRHALRRCVKCGATR